MKSLIVWRSCAYAALCLSLVTMVPACMLEMSADEEPVIDEVEAKLWTGWTSEEFPPLECAAGRLVHGVECHGRYCDNIRLDCVSVTGSFGDSYWTSFFSEEGTNYRYCGYREWMTGIQCNDSYCDDVSIRCTSVPARPVGSCAWSSAYSEEDGPYLAPAGYYLRGVKCTGRYCDNMSYYRCQLL